MPSGNKYQAKRHNLASDLNSILDILEQEDDVNVAEIYLNAPEDDDSDGYDHSDTEEGEPSSLSGNILKATVAEVRTVSGETVLEEYLDGAIQEEEEEEEDDLPAAKKMRDQFLWQDSPTSFRSRRPPIFPAGNYQRYHNMRPRELLDLMLGQDILQEIADR